MTTLSRPWPQIRQLADLPAGQQVEDAQFCAPTQAAAPAAHRYATLLIGAHLDKFRPWADFRQQTQRCKFASLRHAIATGLPADHRRNHANWQLLSLSCPPSGNRQICRIPPSWVIRAGVPPTFCKFAEGSPQYATRSPPPGWLPAPIGGPCALAQIRKFTNPPQALRKRLASLANRA